MLQEPEGHLSDPTDRSLIDARKIITSPAAQHFDVGRGVCEWITLQLSLQLLPWRAANEQGKEQVPIKTSELTQIPTMVLPKTESLLFFTAFQAGSRVHTTECSKYRRLLIYCTQPLKIAFIRTPPQLHSVNFRRLFLHALTWYSGHALSQKVYFPVVPGSIIVKATLS